MTFEIERGIPIPNWNYGNVNAKGYAAILRKLEPGDSVVLPTTSNAISTTCARVLGKGNYVTRVVKGGVRIWRRRSQSAMLRMVEHLIEPKEKRRA